MKKTKGSLSLEAVISFTVFLSFMFMLLMMVKMSLIAITLDNVTSETAKEIATSAYPIGLFNNMSEDSYDKVVKYENITGFTDAIIDAKSKSIVTYITALTEKDVTKAENSGKTALLSVALDFTFEEIGNALLNKGAELIGKKGNEMVQGIIVEGINDYYSGIDFDNLQLAVCKFPMAQEFYKNNCDSEGYTLMGITKDDFGKDDVVIGLTYDYELSLPFLPTITVKIKSLAIEHAWINGESVDTISMKEGINISEKLAGKSFYVGSAGNSKCYHKQTCITLWKYEPTPVTKKYIQDNGLTECRVCRPGKIIK